MKEMPKARGGGDRKSEEYHRGISAPSDQNPTLAEAGIDKDLAKRARKFARMEEDEFETRARARK